MIGTHMASLNLFREQDGTLEITASGASQELMKEWRDAGELGRPIDYVERLVVEAADRIKNRLSESALREIAALRVEEK